MSDWLPVLGYEGKYLVSRSGQVWSLISSRELKSSTLVRGYLGVSLVPTTGSKKTYGVHRLVLDAFVGTRPQGMVARHLNGIPTDNRLENLAWGTQSDNIFDAVRHGTHRAHNRLKTHCINGHEFTEENTYIRTNSIGRDCQKCRAYRRQKHLSTTRIGWPQT